ncbi:MAG: hypothetical protein KatS3mg032_0995 [Cyclobacteriaceae bacterium]|nr:MAG: hypothetical protein KatS3mg032_0995 [Cyclobacteriaceae bacterium]
MKKFLWLLPLLAACDPARIYEQYYDFPERYWPVNEKPEFSFSVTDTSASYNLYVNLRHDNNYPFANLYFIFALADSSAAVYQKLHSADLFDKNGRPLGKSGIGFLFDRRVPVLKDFRFRKPGPYTVTLEHFMRTDTLRGMRAAGLRVERSNLQ